MIGYSRLAEHQATVSCVEAANILQEYNIWHEVRPLARDTGADYLQTLNRRKPNHRMAAQVRRKIANTGRKDAARRGQQCTIA